MWSHPPISQGLPAPHSIHKILSPREIPSCHPELPFPTAIIPGALRRGNLRVETPSYNTPEIRPPPASIIRAPGRRRSSHSPSLLAVHGSAWERQGPAGAPGQGWGTLPVHSAACSLCPNTMSEFLPKSLSVTLTLTLSPSPFLSALWCHRAPWSRPSPPLNAVSKHDRVLWSTATSRPPR